MKDRIISQELLNRTIREFQPHYKEPLTLEDAKEIVGNLYDLAELLIEMYEKKKIKETDRLKGNT